LRYLAIIGLVALTSVPVCATTLLKGVVRANEEKGEPMANVGLVADGSNPTTSEDFGRFTLEFPQKNPGDWVEVIVKQVGYVAVNDVQLQLTLPAKAGDKTLTIILCKEGDREEMARRFYRLKGFDAIEQTYRNRVKELEDTQQTTAAALTKLQQERDQAKASAEKLAEEMAKNQPGQSSELYKQAQRLFLDGKIDAAIALLDDDKLRRSAEQAEKTLADAIQGWRLKARLFTLKYRFDEAEKAYETALRYINRETNPQLWAETEVDLGITHAELGIRVEGKAGNEHLAAAITAYRSALEVYTREQLPQKSAMTQNNLGIALWDQVARTEGARGAELLAQAVTAYRSALEVRTREQLPQDWALTQNNLGLALWDQAARTKGAKGTELLAQAVAALNSCLEIYTPEAFPVDHMRAQEQLKECERLLTQAKPQAQ
jgi:tetratricopeptide (TPR) repeat protein